MTDLDLFFDSSRDVAMIPYVEKVSEAIAIVMKKYNVPVAMKPWKTLKGSLVLSLDDRRKKT